jgi:peptide/nickel transport system permease protein
MGLGMLRYILKRVGYFIPTILGVSIIVFLLMRFIPGDPIEIMLGQHATPEIEEIARRQLGLDKPIYIQFVLWFRNMLMGNWGRSIFNRVPVIKLILRRFNFTIRLALLSMVELSFFGLLLGIISAYKLDSITDKSLRIFGILWWSAPSFVTALILLYVFAVYLGLFPAIGGGGIEHFILPSFSISLGGMGYISRMTRGSILEVVGQDFVKTAQAKGLTKRRIMLHHILKNALIPVVTVIAMQFGMFLGGSFIIETIFALPGLGELTTRSILNRDYPVVQGAVFFIALMFSSTNLIVDIIYTYLDPRVRYERGA